MSDRTEQSGGERGSDLPVECGTCGEDLREPGQWLACRDHYTARIRDLEQHLEAADEQLTAFETRELTREKVCADATRQLATSEARAIEARDALQQVINARDLMLAGDVEPKWTVIHTADLAARVLKGE